MENLLITKEYVFSNLPVRTPQSHKGTFGKVLAYCGCVQYRGAAPLSVLGAQKVGCGIASLLAEEPVIQSVTSLIPHATFLPLPCKELDTVLPQYQSVLAGCGKQNDKITLAMVERIVKHNLLGKIVLDAGALLASANDKNLWQKGRTIITPHIGEMAQLTGLLPAQILQQPQAVASAMAKQWQVVVVLKSHQTIVANPSGEVLVNNTGNAGLAKGGSGDILAGMIAGLCAQGMPCFEAAACAVWLHGTAADMCAKQHSMCSMMPTDILPYLEKLFLENEQKNC